ncbi:hypothetical protein SASPL_120775 [Salvia splendens]|uniref:Uncharacterized protein n=1 Tax=Salvia splendens TaxID=180675 RepID=A0A8X8ZVY7_SALSN|nr:hypothetical protein SASPL_120775 [Salvia splendens]
MGGRPELRPLQPPKSVIYVSFGSIALVTREQALELLNSCQRFLWVMRPYSVAGKDGIPRDLIERSGGVGAVVLSIIEKAIRDLMEVRKEEFLERAENMARLVKESVSEEGWSY